MPWTIGHDGVGFGCGCVGGGVGNVDQLLQQQYHIIETKVKAVLVSLNAVFFSGFSVQIILS